MNLASQKLCEELHDLTKWESETGSNGLWYLDGGVVIATWVEGATPAYDIGFMLTKMRPVLMSLDDGSLGEVLRLILSEENPADHLCRMAIELQSQIKSLLG